MPKSPLPAFVVEQADRALTLLEKQTWLPFLLGRFAVGLLFASTGWGKIHNLEKVTKFFVSLHIPMPALNAVVVGYSELVCGSLLIVGLGTRLSTLPLIMSMIVALLTAKRSDIHGVTDLVGQDELTYLVLLVVILFVGPGRASLDGLLAKKLFPRAARSLPGAARSAGRRAPVVRARARARTARWVRRVALRGIDCAGRRTARSRSGLRCGGR